MLLALALLTPAGCAGPDEVVTISPEPAGRDRADLGLGPGVRALSTGPGEKGSPSWSPSGDRIAFTIDGYVVDKPVGTGDLRRWTTRDFGAEKVEWASEENLAILGTDRSGAEYSAAQSGAPRSVYRTRAGGPGESSMSVRKITAEALAMDAGPGGKGLIVALRTGTSDSGLVLIGEDGEPDRIYRDRLEGRITGVSLSPDGRRAVLAVQEVDGPDPGAPGSFALYAFDLEVGTHRRIARLEEGLEIFGAPQWTEQAIYYVAGKETASDAALYDLYRVAPDSDESAPAPGVGEDFVASSLSVSPEGERLAVIGRRNPGSSTNLYLLDPSTEDLEALTSNENMEIKTGPDDLAWSADGASVAIVARGVLSGPKVYSARADTLLADFYNLYEVPVEGAGAG
jgi:Tol biopolymer transport system component